MIQPSSNFDRTRDRFSLRSVVRSASQEVWESTFKRFNAFVDCRPIRITDSLQTVGWINVTAV